MDDYINDFSAQVHDNKILSYQVDFKNNVLTMSTIWESKEETSISFTGLLAHRFEHVIEPNIIFGIYQITNQAFIEENKSMLTESLKYGFPSSTVNNCDELLMVLANDKYNVYEINSSTGLCGWVIAKGIDFNIGDKLC